MAKRYYLYYKQIGSGNLTVGKPSGYSNFLHNPDAKRMSFALSENSGKAQEQIGKFVQDFQRLNVNKFSISNTSIQNSSTPTPSPGPGPSPKPPVGGTDPKPNVTKIVTSGKIEPEKKEEKEDNTMLIGGAVVLILIGVYVWKNSQKKSKKKR
ncbi:conserved hypothetical protein [Leptospira interrogans serovar Manilae]|uniref:Uncharacterized protein n=1 Tax=Leptospira interrogans serovar Manilae TaxID=214675 RepID=A0AAQ1P0T3_LEPIR|nr:hypothetical protein [Leptospira interrogans]AKP25954.1 hypothetical protein LIMLP_08365 [Leptospira interrogans serovar Manilae]AKP29739.1 hypothetical protein LIMHP_08360 [Leptospira interrogans serovar Manilae]EYU62502.1 hypothetical protein CI00_20170 [Leptospira interrogans serovar Manilae]SOR63383.1 conserved hypothetical protein [Leptospira interrogans serovar Manilae]